jgi:hypothetical protein
MSDNNNKPGVTMLYGEDTYSGYEQDRLDALYYEPEFDDNPYGDDADDDDGFVDINEAQCLGQTGD